MKNYRIYFSCISHIGNCRSSNQDNFICDGQYMILDYNKVQFPIKGVISTKYPSVFGIFDGLGGEECGETASFMAAQNASKLSIGKDAVASLLKYCTDTNDKICTFIKDNALSAMGTTAAILIFTGKKFVLCNIGDSKIFQLSKGTMCQLSRDHVGISAYGTKPPLLQYLGIPHSELVIRPYIVKGTFNAGDIYLICSDGLTDMLEVDELKVVLEHTEFDRIAQTLLSRVLYNGGKDNVSMIVCKIEHGVNRLF